MYTTKHKVGLVWSAAVLLLSVSLCLCGSLSSAGAIEPWGTYRGNPQRTGNADGKPGPARPAVLWVHKTQDNIIASPVPVADRLFVSGFSGFNLPTVALLSTDPKADKRVVWSKSIPLL